MTGLVGAAGGLGGFLLPSLLGAIKDKTGQYGIGILLFAAVFAIGSAALLLLGSSWRNTWNEGPIERSGVFCYRALARQWFGRSDVVEDEG
jgi:NNP family nitrate/nitrite transporter-like MFS transporter